MKRINDFLLESKEEQSNATLIIKPQFLYIATAIKEYYKNKYESAKKYERDLYNEYLEFKKDDFIKDFKDFFKISEDDLYEFSKYAYNKAYNCSITLNKTVKLNINHNAQIKSQSNGIKVDLTNSKDGKK